VIPRAFGDVFYLHGFTSSGRSKKAAYFAERLRPYGIALRCPDFNEPDFASLTITRMLDRLAADLGTPGQPSLLIGSSLGAIVALHTAARVPDRVDRLVLLAPALMFLRDAGKILGSERVERWQATGTLDLFHQAYGGMRSLNYGFYEDSLQYDAFAVDVRQPTLVFQGLRDQAVDHRVVEQYAAERPNVQLTLVDDDHQLMASLPRIWSEMAVFLELT
jgi:pimeloyl-ACP methyl ester carboxylesterase